MGKIKKIDIVLPKTTVRSINRAVEQGSYANASEVVIHALRMWMQAEKKTARNITK